MEHYVGCPSILQQLYLPRFWGRGRRLLATISVQSPRTEVFQEPETEPTSSRVRLII